MPLIDPVVSMVLASAKMMDKLELLRQVDPYLFAGHGDGFFGRTYSRVVQRVRQPVVGDQLPIAELQQLAERETGLVLSRSLVSLGFH